MSLRQNKKDNLREKIIRTSIEMFCNNGFQQTTIDDIVCKLEISKRTFFRYFPTKEDAVLSLYDNLTTNDNIESGADLNTGNPINAIKIIFKNFAKTYVSKSEYFLNVEKLINCTPSINVRKIEKILQCTIQVSNSFQKYSKHDYISIANHNFLIHFSMGIFMSSISTWLESNGQIDLKKTIDDGFNLINDKIYLAYES